MPTAIIELAVGVVFVFFLLGSACSFLNELVAAVLDRRAAHLEAWIYKMLGRDLAERFFADPRIVALRRPRAGRVRRTGDQPELALDQARLRELSEHPGGPAAEQPAPRPSGLGRLLHPERKVPSYIEPDTFARTLLAILQEQASPDQAGAAEAARGSTAERPFATAIRRLWRCLFPTRQATGAVDGVPPATTPLANLVANAPPGWPTGLLSALLDDACGMPDAFLERLRQWFDEEMDRLSGWYKRRTKLFLLLFGGLLAVLLNVDAVLVTRTLWNDPTVRAAVVAQAQQQASTSTVPATTVPATTVAPTTVARAAPPATTPTTSCPAATGGGSASTTTADPLDCLASRVQTLRSLQLPIGWPGWPWHWAAAYRGSDPRFPHQPGAAALKLFGLVVTALAAAQGGPFWFDLLGRLVNLKLTGPPAPPAGGTGG